MLEQEHLAGAVYSIVDRDRTYVGAAGLFKAGGSDPLTPESKVHIGSIAKTLIALGVLRLATRRSVDLDARVAQLLPNVALDNAWDPHSPVRLRHLLDHTSGLGDARLWQVFSEHVDAHSPLADAFRRDPRVLRIRTEPGAQFSYSNTGYTLAGMVIEAVTGERYETWLDRELLAPLGMHDSTFQFVSQSGASADAQLAWGHHDDLSPASSLPVALRPATQFTTTAADMGRLARFLMSDGKVNGAVFVAEDLLRQMGRPSTTAAARAGLEAGYALGLAKRDRHGAVGLCHSGNIVGYRAVLCMYPREQKAFFISQNTDSETADYDRFDAMLARALDVQTPVSASVDATSPAAWEGRYAPSPARFDQFRYLEVLFESIVFDVHEGVIQLRGFGEEPRVLNPVGPRLYRAAERRAASHVLLQDPAGVRVLSDGFRSMQKVGYGWYAHALSLALGVAGLVIIVSLGPLERMYGGGPLIQPAFIGALLLAVPIPLFALQSFTALGERTAASVALYGVTLILPVLLVWHLVWTARNRRRLRWRLAHALAVAFVLQWCVSLYAWDLLPLALWS